LENKAEKDGMLMEGTPRRQTYFDIEQQWSPGEWQPGRAHSQV